MSPLINKFKFHCLNGIITEALRGCKSVANFLRVLRDAFFYSGIYVYIYFILYSGMFFSFTMVEKVFYLLNGHMSVGLITGRWRTSNQNKYNHIAWQYCKLSEWRGELHNQCNCLHWHHSWVVFPWSSFAKCDVFTSICLWMCFCFFSDRQERECWSMHLQFVHWGILSLLPEEQVRFIYWFSDSI